MNERDDRVPKPRRPRGARTADEVPAAPRRRRGRSVAGGGSCAVRDDRVIAGVAGGLGNYFDIDPMIIRIAFAVSVLFGGLGGRRLPGGRNVRARRRRDRCADRARSRAAMSRGSSGCIAHRRIAFAGFGALVGAGGIRDRPRLRAAGGGGRRHHRDRPRGVSFRGGARWLIVPALALSIGVGVAAAADLDLKGGIGDREYRPQSVAAIPDDGYELGIGRLAVDLRGIDWSPKQVIDLDVQGRRRPGSWSRSLPMSASSPMPTPEPAISRRRPAGRRLRTST